MKFPALPLLQTFNIDATLFSSMLNTTINTAVVSSPYVDINIWYFITAIGLLLFLISNITTKEQNNSLWAVLCPFFTFPSMYFALNYCVTDVQQTWVNNTQQVMIQQTVYHPEWLAFVFGVIFICSIINIWYVVTKEPIERQKKDNI
ncbi:MAG: hypothetical protein PHC39_04575 [Proteiniphilum sp.]|nr:hypothetical protein [Proteiniphilum sp.]